MKTTKKKRNTLRPKGIEICLATCRRLYEDHFGAELPHHLPYRDAAHEVKVDMDDFEAFEARARKIEAEVNPPKS